VAIHINIKICTAKQSKEVYLYKTIKTKLYKNNAAIWFNKTCRIKQLTSTYVNIIKMLHQVGKKTIIILGCTVNKILKNTYEFVTKRDQDNVLG